MIDFLLTLGTGLVVGFAIGCVAMDHFVLKRHKENAAEELEEALQGWAHTIAMLLRLAKDKGVELEKDEQGNIISPIQFNRKGS